MRHALIRGIPDSFAAALHGDRGRTPDVDLARTQHDSYRSMLMGSGYHITDLPASEAHPDCVFIEDAGVVLGDVAVAANPGAESRRGEVAPVAEALEQTFPLHRIESPGTLDGGDVLVVNRTVYIGLSRRTNVEGADQLERIARAEGLGVVQVPVADVLHLKSGVLAVDEETLVITRGTVDESLFGGFRIIHEEPEERNQFSCLVVAPGKVMTTSAAPRTSESVAKLGIDVHPLDVSEILAVDGGLTCMSILFEPPGA